jgi:metal-sulfur cluster biosynthetic enzyme
MFSQTSQPCQFERDCDVVMIPSGDEVRMPAGTVGYITQALGGSFTVFVDGNLFRVAGVDADAIGKEPVQPPKLADNASDDDVEKLVWNQMKTCYDPEIPVNIVDLGLIYDCTLTNGVRSKIALIPTISEVQVELTFEPLWNHQMMSEVARLETGMY